MKRLNSGFLFMFVLIKMIRNGVIILFRVVVLFVIRLGSFFFIW